MSKKKKDMPKERKEEALMCDQMHFDAKEAYKLLRTNVIYSLPDKKCRKVGITSATVGEGKSTVAVNLAYTLSATKSKVLLIELDLRLPTIAKKLSMKYEYGLSDYLAGKTSDKNIICHTGKHQWDIIFSGTIPPTPTELISSEKFINFVKKMEKVYEYIIFDLPPVNIVSDALVAKEVLDGYVLVARENYSDKHSLRECAEKLDFLSIPILGYVLVESSAKPTYYRKKHYGKYGKYSKYGKYRNHYYGKYGHYYSQYENSHPEHQSKEVINHND